jgi:hypothetical protein
VGEGCFLASGEGKGKLGDCRVMDFFFPMKSERFIGMRNFDDHDDERTTEDDDDH